MADRMVRAGPLMRREHSITMFLLPEGATLGSRLKLENFQWELV